MKILITAALKEEMNPVKSFIRTTFSSKFLDDISFLKTGIGNRNVVKSIKNCLESGICDFVINIGSAGSLSPNIKVGDILQPTFFFKYQRQKN